MAKPDQVAIVGVGETEYKRKHDRHLPALIVEAGRRAIEDAGLTPDDIDGFVSIAGQPPADELAVGLGVRNRRYTGTNAYCAGAGTVGAAMEAAFALRSGLASAVLVSYGIQTSRPGGPYSFHSREPLKADLEMPFGYFGQPVYFGAMAQRYGHLYGLSERQLAAIPIAHRDFASRTPGAQKTDPLDFDGYLASPMISDPLRNLDCCLITDGAAAYVMTTMDRARDLRHRPAVMAGVAAASLPVTLAEMFTQNRDFLQFAAAQSSSRAYEMAGITPKDADFAEIYDCFTISVILQLEQMGFCGTGEGAAFVEGGHIGARGGLPVNTHGGHLSHGYVPGMNHIVEAVRQIRRERGEGQLAKAEVGVIGGLGGNDHATMVLTA
jgi:acetyl-CoA acetyltransferase